MSNGTATGLIAGQSSQHVSNTEGGRLWLYSQPRLKRWGRQNKVRHETKNETSNTLGKWKAMKVLQGTSVTNQPFFTGWYNSGWGSSRKKNNKENKTVQKEIKKENGFFQNPYLYYVNAFLSLKKTCLKYPTDKPAVRSTANHWKVSLVRNEKGVRLSQTFSGKFWKMSSVFSLAHKTTPLRK